MRERSAAVHGRRVRHLHRVDLRENPGTGRPQPRDRHLDASREILAGQLRDALQAQASGAVEQLFLRGAGEQIASGRRAFAGITANQRQDFGHKIF
jgi:hypothetical protein